MKVVVKLLPIGGRGPADSLLLHSRAQATRLKACNNFCSTLIPTRAFGTEYTVLQALDSRSSLIVTSKDEDMEFLDHVC